MDLTHTFTVPATIGDTWTAFNDIESVAGCFPGATVTSVEGDEFKGSCKVKLGPISLVYSGTGKFLERDDDAHRFVIEAKGKDKRGNGTAGATVTAVLTSTAADSTDVEVRTDLSITGKPAQFGRGVIQDVSDKLLQQFVTCLESKVGGPEPAASADAGKHVADPGAGVDGSTRKAAASTYAGVSAGGEPGDGTTGAPAGTTGSSTSGGAANGHATSGGAAQDNGALDLGATVLPVLVKAYWKPVAGVLLALLVLRKLLGGR
jgi:uncharacterized protein